MPRKIEETAPNDPSESPEPSPSFIEFRPSLATSAALRRTFISELSVLFSPFLVWSRTLRLLFHLLCKSPYHAWSSSSLGAFKNALVVSLYNTLIIFDVYVMASLAGAS